MTAGTPHYERLAEGERRSRRTVADALEVLRQQAGFSDADCVEVHLGRFRLPSGELVALVDLQFHTEPKTYVVSLPTSAHFTAKRPPSAKREEFDIVRLDCAIVEGDGHVRLADGTMLSAVEVQPANLPLEPSDLDWKIVHHTIALIEAEDHCYRRLEKGLPGHLQDGQPDIRLLDCSRLAGLKLPGPKVIAHYIAKRDPAMKKLSHQKIADALTKFGMRHSIPRARTR